MKATFDNDWDVLLESEFKKNYYQQLQTFLKSEYQTKEIFPDIYDIFNAFKYTAYGNIKVVIIGQDPYHGDGQAHGLCFSVSKDIKIPPSLNNIYKEMQEDIGTYIPNNGYLKKWTEEGVLLLNTVLTVQAHKAASHRGIGWDKFTDHIIKLIDQKEKPVVFILWGSFAISKEKLITNPIHHIIKSTHPSPLSAYRGFFGSQPFSKTNAFLKSCNIKEINWQIPNI